MQRPTPTPPPPAPEASNNLNQPSLAGYQYNWSTDTALSRINYEDQSRVSQYLTDIFQFFNPQYRKASGNYLSACAPVYFSSYAD
jgi:glutamine amidotransferase-like uncharacterized protein